MKALALESDPPALPSLGTLLEGAEIELHSTTSLELPWSQQIATPDLVLCDTRTLTESERRQAWSACVRLTHEPATAHTPVFVLTALDRPSDVASAFSCGATEVFVAPTSGASFTERLQRRLREPHKGVAPLPLHTSSEMPPQAANILTSFIATLEELNSESQRQTATLQKLTEADLRREKLLSIVAHDLRTPLGTLRMGTELINRTMAQEGKPASIVRPLDRAVDVMNQIVSDLPELYALEARDFSLQRDTHHVATLLHDVARSLQPLLDNKALSLCERTVADDLYVSCDRESVYKILSRWFLHRSKVLRAGDTFTLDAKAAESQVRISMSDAGPDIDETQQRSLFVPYWQADRATRAHNSLGLSVAFGLVRAHQGDVTAHQTPGGGTTFEFTLPRATRSPGSAHL